MAKYCWTFLWQILYFCTVIFSRTWSREIDLNNPTCANNEFGYMSPNGQLMCKPCSNLPKCPNGLGVSVACGHIARTHVQCVECVLGKNFSAEYDHLPCETCQSNFCHENEKIIGSCTVDKLDTSKCSGTCKKGFYSSDGDLKNCQPCSSCLNNASARVKKCNDDGLPIEKQCEVGSVVPTALPSKKQLPSKKNGEKHSVVEGYKFYGHPAMFSFFLIVIVVLSIILAVVVLRRKFRKKTQSPVVPLTEVTSNTDSSVVETDVYDGSSDLPPVEAVRRRKSSAGSAVRKVSVSRQISSNSNNGSDFSGERPGSAQPPELPGENDVFEEKPERKRTLSGSSGKRKSIFGRQNSNPAAEQNEERPFNRRSSTFSNFSTIFSGQKTGTKDETTSLLSSTDYNDNDIPPQVVALPAETSSSTGIAPHRLSGLKIGDLNAETHRQLCRKLNIDVSDKDWRTLAGRMKYTTQQVKEFARDANPADKLLDYWSIGDGHDVACLIELVKGMNRNDLVELLESEPNPTTFYL